LGDYSEDMKKKKNTSASQFTFQSDTICSLGNRFIDYFNNALYFFHAFYVLFVVEAYS